MNFKHFLPILFFTFIIITSLIYLASKNEEYESNKQINYDVKQKYSGAISLSSLQTSACNAAEIGGTCNTRLKELNLVTTEECCYVLGKCCKK